MIEDLNPLLELKAVRKQPNQLIELDEVLILPILVSRQKVLIEEAVELAHDEEVFGDEALQLVELQEELDDLRDSSAALVTEDACGAVSHQQEVVGYQVLEVEEELEEALEVQFLAQKFFEIVGQEVGEEDVDAEGEPVLLIFGEHFEGG